MLGVNVSYSRQTKATLLIRIEFNVWLVGSYAAAIYLAIFKVTLSTEAHSFQKGQF